MKGSIQRLVLLTPESFQSFVRTPMKNAHILGANDETVPSGGEEAARELNCTHKMPGSLQTHAFSAPLCDTSPPSSSTSSAPHNTGEPEDALNNAVRSSLGGLDALFLYDLYFVARDGEIDGMHSKQKDWALGAISRDPRVDVDLSDEAVLKEIRTEMLLRKQHSLSTMEMLHLYKQYDVQNQICLIGKFDA